MKLEQNEIEIIADLIVQKLKPMLRPTLSEKEDDGRLMTVHELAEYMKVSPEFIYKLTSANEIPHIKRGDKFLRFKKYVIIQWLDKFNIPSAKPFYTNESHRKRQSDDD